MNLSHSKTLENLINAFAGESQARNRYTFYAKQAKKEGYENIAAVFLETADNEKQHAKQFYKHIPANKYQVNGYYPFSLGNTYDNLIAAAEGEREEWEYLYKQSAQTAREEGFDEIALLFEKIVDIEKRHAHRFSTIAYKLKEGSWFERNEETQWVCRKCGHTQICKIAPKECIVCKHPQGYFQVYNEKL